MTDENKDKNDVSNYYQKISVDWIRIYPQSNIIPYLSTIDHLNVYLERYSKEMRTEGMKKFTDSIEIKRRILTKIWKYIFLYYCF